MKIASDRRDEFRRVLRSHPKWNQCRESCGLPKNPDSDQWLQAAQWLQVDPTPYSVGADIEQAMERTPVAPVTPLPSNQTNELAQSIAALIEAQQQPQAPVVDDKHIIDLIHKHTKEPVKVVVDHRMQDGSERQTDLGIVHKSFQHCLDVLLAGMNLQMVGPAGSGKTTLAKQLHQTLFPDNNKEFAFTGALSQEYKLFGFIDAGGVYRDTPYYRVYKNGGSFLFDEYDGSLPNAVLPFNTALDNGHCDFPHECTEKHGAFYAISACNTFGTGADRQYVGRYQQDAAALERWVPIVIGYDEDLEATLTDNADWCYRVQQYRKAMESLKIRHICSPRATKHGGKLLAAGWNIKDVEDAVIWKGLEKETVKKIRSEASI